MRDDPTIELHGLGRRFFDGEPLPRIPRTLTGAVLPLVSAEQPRTRSAGIFRSVSEFCL